MYLAIGCVKREQSGKTALAKQTMVLNGVKQTQMDKAIKRQAMLVFPGW